MVRGVGAWLMRRNKIMGKVRPGTPVSGKAIYAEAQEDARNAGLCSVPSAAFKEKRQDDFSACEPCQRLAPDLVR